MKTSNNAPQKLVFSAPQNTTQIQGNYSTLPVTQNGRTVVYGEPKLVHQTPATVYSSPVTFGGNPTLVSATQGRVITSPVRVSQVPAQTFARPANISATSYPTSYTQSYPVTQNYVHPQSTQISRPLVSNVAHATNSTIGRQVVYSSPIRQTSGLTGVQRGVVTQSGYGLNYTA